MQTAEEEPLKESVVVEDGGALPDVVELREVPLVDISVLAMVDVLIEEGLDHEWERGEEEVVETDVPVVINCHS